MISHTQFLTIVHGVRATLVVPDAVKTVALLTYSVIDSSFQATVHKGPLCREQAAWIPSVCIAEVA